MSDAYFTGLNAALRGQGTGRPVILLDLDRLDHNLDLISAGLAEHYRLVTKSLPCTQLIEYVLSRTGTGRLMAFHLPFLGWMLEAFPDTDLLMGKPFLLVALQEFFANNAGDAATAARRVQWLVDTPARLDEHLALAGQFGVKLRINIEIDVGLHRGGVSDTRDLDTLLDMIAAHPDRLGFSGFMGYDAQVPFMPVPDIAFERAMALYDGFIRHGEAHYPELFTGELTFNSGGSKTWQRFGDGMVVNDVAAGSALVKPAAFDSLDSHLPALFIAAPVIRKFPRVSRREIAPDKAMSLYLYGGGWAAELAHPPGVAISPHADPPNQNLLPNQCLFETSLNTGLAIGDFVFFRPHQGDAVVQFEEVLVVRDGEIVDRWHPFPRRY